MPENVQVLTANAALAATGRQEEILSLLDTIRISLSQFLHAADAKITVTEVVPGPDGTFGEAIVGAKVHHIPIRITATIPVFDIAAAEAAEKADQELAKSIGVTNLGLTD